jgi:ankyrin repeat protein
MNGNIMTYIRNAPALLALAALLAMVGCSEKAGAPTAGTPAPGSSLPVLQQIKDRLEEASKTGNLTGATARGDLEKVRRLLQSGANANEDVGQGADSITPLMAAVILNRNEIGLELMNFGARADARFKGYSIREFANEVLSDGSALRKGVMQR